MIPRPEDDTDRVDLGKSIKGLRSLDKIQGPANISVEGVFENRPQMGLGGGESPTGGGGRQLHLE